MKLVGNNALIQCTDSIHAKQKQLHVNRLKAYSAAPIQTEKPTMGKQLVASSIEDPNLQDEEEDDENDSHAN